MLLFDDKVSQTVAIEIDPQNGDCLEGMRLHSIQPNQRHSEWIRGRQERLKKNKQWENNNNNDGI